MLEKRSTSWLNDSVSGSMPAPFEEALRSELSKVVRQACHDGHDHFPNVNDCCVLLAYCGDKRVEESLEDWRGGTWDVKDCVSRRREELRIRALEALLYPRPPAGRPVPWSTKF